MPLLLHMSDVHLGARHRDLGESASKQRERQSAAFGRAVELALERNVEAVLICGDLFDTNAQPRRTVEQAAAQLRRLTERGIHVVIIPGTHDVYDERSIYRVFDLAVMCGLPAGSDLLMVLTPEHPDTVLTDLDMVVYGRVFATKRAPHSPLLGFTTRADQRARWKVAMIHGSRNIPGMVDNDEVMFTDAEVAASELDYLALGHWHSFTSGRAGRTLWAYPGAPEPVAVDQDGAGSVCLVQLSGEGGAREVGLEQVNVGRTTFRKETVDAAGIASQDELVRSLAQAADPDVVLEVRVIGVARDDLELRPEEVERQLAASFLHVRCRDESVAHLSDDLRPSTDTIAGAFVAAMEARIHETQAQGDEGAAAESLEVLRLGRRLLLDDPNRVTLA